MLLDYSTFPRKHYIFLYPNKPMSLDLCPIIMSIERLITDKGLFRYSLKVKGLPGYNLRLRAYLGANQWFTAFLDGNNKMLKS